MRKRARRPSLCVPVRVAWQGARERAPALPIASAPLSTRRHTQARTHARDGEPHSRCWVRHAWQEYGDVFFHCDQIIRGLYEPFLRDWHAALGDESLLVLRVEDLLDQPDRSRAKMLSFLGLPASSASLAPAPAKSYAQVHSESLRQAKAQTMLDSTRLLAERFYLPHNERLGTLLKWPRAMVWPHSTRAELKEAAAAALAALATAAHAMR